MRKLIIVTVLLSVLAHAQGVAQERKKTPALREQVYSQLARAQQLLDEGNSHAGLQVLQEIERKQNSMNSYERAMLWSFYGYFYYGQDNPEQAIHYFDRVVAEEAIPVTLEQNTLFSLAQLSLGQSNYSQALDYLARWEQLVPAAQQQAGQILKAQALYQQQEYSRALPIITNVIEQATGQGQRPEENWLVLQRAIYYELHHMEQVAAVLEDLVRFYNKPEYWVQLAGVYGQLDEHQKQLAVLEAAYQLGYLTTEAELLNLAQTYFFNEVPFKAGQLIETGLQQGTIAPTLATLQLMAQAWVAARETDKANEALLAAAKLSDTGELDAQRATLLLNTERYDEALVAARHALAKGQLRQPGMMYLVIGMAELNLANFNAALQAFALAKQYEDAQQLANQWEQFTQAEQRQLETLQKLRDVIQSSS